MPGYSSYYGWGSYAWPFYSYNNSCGYSRWLTVYSYLPSSVTAAIVTLTTQTTQAAPTTAPLQTQDSQSFAVAGERYFKDRNFAEAVRAWRHALVEDPKNGVLILMLAQGLFATNQYEEAAGATQQAMLLLPETYWGVASENYRELYSDIDDYTAQLRALEKTAADKPNDPALHFLVGYPYGYLGYPKDAVRELKLAMDLAPYDEIARKLEALMAKKLKS